MARARLRSEQIYEAMVDDDAFANLPTILAESVGARSCVIHWRDSDEQAEVMAHSTYFSTEQMANYAVNFVEHDEWSNFGKQAAFLNRVWNTKEFVAPSHYERSIFYNEWIREMGDDTFHCIGSVMETGRGLGLIGLHRGKGQSDFDAEANQDLTRNIVHLRRMLTVRARMVSDAARLRGLGAMLDANPAPMIATNAQGRIVHANAAGEALLRQGTLLGQVAGRLHTSDPVAATPLAVAIARAADPAAPSAGAVTVSAAFGQRLELTLSPIAGQGVGLVLLVGRDPEATLRRALAPVDPADSIAPRELQVAKLVGMGLRNRDIAARTGLTEGTVKVYLHALFTKVGVSSRTELALRVGGHAPRDGKPLTFDN